MTIHRRQEGWTASAQPVVAAVARRRPIEYAMSGKPWRAQRADHTPEASAYLNFAASRRRSGRVHVRLVAGRRAAA